LWRRQRPWEEEEEAIRFKIGGIALSATAASATVILIPEQF
jgi:hypothetical protein